MWLGNLRRLEPDPELRFFFREEIGHDALGYPPPTIEIALASSPAPAARSRPACPRSTPELLARTVEIPDLGTMTDRGVDAVDHRAPDQPRRAGPRHPAQPGRPVRAAVLTGLETGPVEDRPEPEAPAGLGGRAGRVGLAVRHRQPPVRRAHRHPVPARARPRLRRAGWRAWATGVDDGIVGTPVAVKPSLPCEDCPECHAGKLLDCQKKKLMGLWSDGCMTEKVAVPRVNLDPAARGRRGVAGVAAGADRGGAQHRRPAADRARRDGDGARAGPDRAGAHPAVRALRARAS